MSTDTSRMTMALVLAAALAAPLTGCESSGSNQTVGTVLGGLGGAAIGAVGGAAVGGRTGAVIGAVAGGVIGGWAGSTIGRRLDERDRQQASTATAQALNQPVQAQRTSSGRTTTRGRQVSWRSDHSGNRGTAQVTNVERRDNGTECRQVREIAYVNGEEVAQNSRYCKDNEGRWARTA